jgi:hypothetical protein
MPPLPVTLATKETGDSTTAGLGLAETTVVVVAGCTVKENGAETLPASFASPEYVATMKYVPAGKAVLIVAVSDAPTVADPRVAPALMKATIPVGAETPLITLTMAVMATAPPAIPGLGTGAATVVEVWA